MNEPTELTLVAQESNLPIEKVESLLKSFTGYFQEAKGLTQIAREIKVTSEDQVAEMSEARRIRKLLQTIRTNAEKTKIQLKEQSLREGNAIQGMFNIIKALVIPVEEHLEAQEKFAENLKIARENEKNTQRLILLSKYVEDTSVYNLKEMADYSFNKLLEGLKLASEASAIALKLAEEEKVAQQVAEKKDQERIILENEQLKKELIGARLDKEQEIEKEKMIKEAELEAKQKSLLAPDKDKLLELALSVDKIVLPNVASTEAGEIIKKAELYLGEVSKFIRDKAKTL